MELCSLPQHRIPDGKIMRTPKSTYVIPRSARISPKKTLQSPRTRGGFASTREARATRFRSAWSAVESVDDFETHLAGSAGDGAESSFIVSRIQVLRLCPNDIHDLLARHFPHLHFVRFLGTGSDVCGFL